MVFLGLEPFWICNKKRLYFKSEIIKKRLYLGFAIIKKDENIKFIDCSV